MRFLRAIEFYDKDCKITDSLIVEPNMWDVGEARVIMHDIPDDAVYWRAVVYMPDVTVAYAEEADDAA
jgi:hypothetical protein